jgi:hypothetical protein
MNDPSHEPHSPPPFSDLGRFCWTMLAVPILLFGAALLASHSPGFVDLAVILLSFAGCGAVISSIVFGFVVGRRSGTGVGFLTIIGTLIVYLSIAFVGCVALFRL